MSWCRSAATAVVGAGGVKAVAVEIGDGAVEKRVGVVGLDFQHAGQGGDGGVVIFDWMET